MKSPVTSVRKATRLWTKLAPVMKKWMFFHVPNTPSTPMRMSRPPRMMTPTATWLVHSLSAGQASTTEIWPTMARIVVMSPMIVTTMLKKKASFRTSLSANSL